MTGLAAGCQFAPSGAAPDDGDGGGGDGGGDDGPAAIDAGRDGAVTPPFCDRDDLDLRLCVTFDGGAVVDQSGRDLALAATAVAFGPGAVGAAVQLTASSVIHGAETPALDLTTALTLEAFVRVAATPSPRAGLIDNNTQYGMWVGANMRPYCTIGSTTVSGPTIFAERWTHVACVFDGQTYRIFVDGAQFGSVNRTAPAPTGGQDGFNLGQDCTSSGSDDPLTGGLDEVRVWASARTPEQLAAAAARRL